MNVVVENTLERLEQVIFDQNGTKLIIVNNESDETHAVTSEINRKNIHFYFCLDGSARFEFSPHYTTVKFRNSATISVLYGRTPLQRK